MEQQGAQAVEQSRAEEQEKKMKVMVAVDESEGSLYALSWGLDHLFPSSASVADSGEVVVVHVQQHFHNYVFPAGPGIMYLPAIYHHSFGSSPSTLSLLPL